MKWCESCFWFVLAPLGFSAVSQGCRMLYNRLFCPPLSELNSPEITCEKNVKVTDGIHLRAQTPACSERANKTQGQELYGRTSRAVEAFGTNVAFRGLAFNPYLTLSLRPSPAPPPASPHTPCPAVQMGGGVSN